MKALHWCWSLMQAPRPRWKIWKYTREILLALCPLIIKALIIEDVHQCPPNNRSFPEQADPELSCLHLHFQVWIWFLEFKYHKNICHLLGDTEQHALMASNGSFQREKGLTLVPFNISIYFEFIYLLWQSHARIQRGTPPENHKNKGFLSNTGLDPLKNHKATNPAFNVGPSSARQRNTIWMAFHWQADDGPLIVVFGSFFLPSSN